MDFKKLMENVLNETDYDIEIIDGFKVIKEEVVTGDVEQTEMPLGVNRRDPDLLGPNNCPAFSINGKAFTKVLRRNGKNKGEWWKKYLSDEGIAQWKTLSLNKNKTFYISYNDVYLKVK